MFVQNGALINSMTSAERRQTWCYNGSRKKTYFNGWGAGDCKIQFGIVCLNNISNAKNDEEVTAKVVCKKMRGLGVEWCQGGGMPGGGISLSFKHDLLCFYDGS